MKKFAYYLPQFHEIPENNEWWGKGFTEWVNVKKAQPLFKGHRQPQIPLNNNYYKLDNPDTLVWQAELAKKYKIDGFIFYNYYFCGKQLLEKPAEILLNNKDIPMKFFFCWANHSWFRSWEGSKELLVEQVYGSESDWERHFQYLLTFFKDDRYEKRDNKPLFLIYKSDFKEFELIFSYFNKRCKEEGFSGIYLFISKTKYDEVSDSILINRFDFEYTYTIREPDACLNEYRKNVFHKIKNRAGTYSRRLGIKYLESYNGDELYNIMNRKKFDSSIARGIFFSWDNTPRHNYRGFVVNEPHKDSYFKYMDTIKNSEYIFINAWNEWCEGMILEPTEEKKYKYLQWIKEWSDKYET
ncbi:glycoside hydrolase family 99-like domain-containing protein [Amedibacillus dolichus]|uniref:glycosyltransferase WbsX family protein n=1 Tax=Amedibacillus dolichus TaxID=31971 RepID=UPI001EDA7510|nr:glycoside hydrolase family 99-like domain-containing protein [Amedibacillus dolichus]MCG4879038.1 glycoside hydrolase family 99-like domain-containing protein [Amedibacillus dolichus]